MSLPFSKIPSAASIAPTPFEASIPQEQVSELKTLVKLSKIASPTYESVQSDRRFGITTAWLASMKEKWVNDFDWCYSPLILSLGGALTGAGELASAKSTPLRNSRPSSRTSSYILWLYSRRRRMLSQLSSSMDGLVRNSVCYN